MIDPPHGPARALMPPPTHSQADTHWHHPAVLVKEEDSVPKEALLVRIPECPRYFAHLAGLEEENQPASALPGTLCPVPPFDIRQ